MTIVFIVFQVRKDFFSMLRESSDVTRHSRWSEVKKKFESDYRYKAVEGSALREDYFRDYVKILKEERRREKDKRDKRDRDSYRDRSRERERSRERDRDRDRERDRSRERSERKKHRSEEKEQNEHEKEVIDFLFFFRSFEIPIIAVCYRRECILWILYVV